MQIASPDGPSGCGTLKRWGGGWSDVQSRSPPDDETLRIDLLCLIVKREDESPRAGVDNRTKRKRGNESKQLNDLLMYQ